MEKGSNSKNIQNCIEPISPEHSLYPYCDENFVGDFHGISRCKTDMCNLCCVTMDAMKSKNFSLDSMRRCYKDCNNGNIFFFFHTTMTMMCTLYYKKNNNYISEKNFFFSIF